MIRNRKPSNYKGFERALDIDFGRFPPENKTALRGLMKQFKYHVVKGDKENPTEKQLNHAWEYLKRNYISEQKTIEYNYRTEHYQRGENKIYIYRATQDLTIGEKTYRKGQFLPKQRND